MDIALSKKPEVSGVLNTDTIAITNQNYKNNDKVHKI